MIHFFWICLITLRKANIGFKLKIVVSNGRRNEPLMKHWNRCQKFKILKNTPGKIAKIDFHKFIYLLDQSWQNGGINWIIINKKSFAFENQRERCLSTDAVKFGLRPMKKRWGLGLKGLDPIKVAQSRKTDSNGKKLQTLFCAMCVCLLA